MDRHSIASVKLQATTRDRYLYSMIIEALLDNGIHDLRDLDIVAQQHLPVIRRIYLDSRLDDAPLSDSLYDQLVGMMANYFSIVLPLNAE